MKILLANAASPSQTEVEVLQKCIFSFFPGLQDLVRVDLHTKNILPCSACMSCQIKTPGVCVRKDDMRELLPVYIHSDVVIIVTPLFCGGYSSELKKFIDRLCPVLTACFEIRNGETWHIPRYEKRPAMIGIGLADDSETCETVFYPLFLRNMKQLNVSKHSFWIIKKGMNSDELCTLFHQSFNKAEIVI